ncbi:hypothetical protein FOCC_FOCC016810 [Frankliniella occidentalis]|nr:hypothetical protein FOCC_FOCC016810 [Frankliniella occidentalis]
MITSLTRKRPTPTRTATTPTRKITTLTRIRHLRLKATPTRMFDAPTHLDHNPFQFSDPGRPGRRGAFLPTNY